MLLGSDLPDLLNPDAVMLGVFPFIQRIVGDKLFSEVATAAFRKDRKAGMQFHTWNVAILLLTVCTDAHLTRCNAFYRTGIVEEDLGCGKAGINLDTQGFGLSGQLA